MPQTASSGKTSGGHFDLEPVLFSNDTIPRRAADECLDVVDQLVGHDLHGVAARPGGMGGQETVPHLRRIRADLPVLVMSGYADNSGLADHGRHGFDGGLPKPFAIPELRTAIAEASARRSTRPRADRQRRIG